MLFEDVGRGVWSSVVYCGCITSGLILLVEVSGEWSSVGVLKVDRFQVGGVFSLLPLMNP